ncbi:MAG TPA: hypothetical protein VNI60_07065 [Pyrinomonadaceae bacterium]|nr:hypothetical protein [Pyrinomonadaceae bacterium]
MIKKVSAIFLACAFLLNGVGMVFAAPDTKKSAGQSAQLATLLPASDGVITVNMRRILSEALPQVLSSNQQMLGEILGKLDKVKNETGLDLRQFEQIAVGVSGKKTSAGEMAFEPVILARGTFNAGALLALAKVAAKGKYREEKIGSRTVYVFSMKQAIAQAKPKTVNPKSSMFEKAIDKMFKGLSDELAVTAYDNNTLAIGSVARVRETFDGKTRVGTDVLDLVNRKPNSIMSFGVKLPAGLSQFVDMDNDEIGKNLEAIRQISGAVDVGDGRASVSLVAKTLEAAQAKSLQETLEGLQMIGKAFIGGAKGADKKVFTRMIDSARISQSGNEVTLDLQVAQSDIDILVVGK